MASLRRGQRAAGDLIPWTVAQQFQALTRCHRMSVMCLCVDRMMNLHGSREHALCASPLIQICSAWGMGRMQSTCSSNIIRCDVSQCAVTIEHGYVLQGEFQLLAVNKTKTGKKESKKGASQEDGSSLLTEKLAPNNSPRELLSKLSDRAPERLHWLGSSFGVTANLYHFWKKAGYWPVYLRLTSNELTGARSSSCHSTHCFEGMPMTCQ